MSSAAAIRAAKQRLRGAWRSDKARSVAQWKFAKPISDKQRREFARMFGRTVWHFGPGICTGWLEDLRWTARYKVLWADEYSAVLHFKDKAGTKCHHLFFDAEYFYVAAGYAGSVEYFRRMPSNSALQRTRQKRRAVERGR
jgi:hypothetical protein